MNFWWFFIEKMVILCVSRGEEKNKRVLVCDRLTYFDGWFLTEINLYDVRGEQWRVLHGIYSNEKTGKQSACECHGNRRGLKLKYGTCRIRNFNAPQGWQWIANINEAKFLWFHKEFFRLWWWWAISMWEFQFFLAASFNEKSPWRKILFHSSMHISCGSVFLLIFRTILFALVRLWWIYSEKSW